MRRYSDILMDHWRAPRNVGRLENPNSVGLSRSLRQPPAMFMHFQLDGDLAQAVRFETFGCGAAIAAGSMLTEMITSRTVKECLSVTRQDLIDALGGLPADKSWCAERAIAAMRDALWKHDDTTTE